MFSEVISEGGIIEAAGGILVRKTRQGKHIAVIHRSRYDDWTLPKGKREKDETFLEAARREIEEETNCRVQPGKFIGCMSYVVNGMPKIVLYWHMTVIGEKPFTPNVEVDKLRWVTVKQAIKILSYDGEKKLVKKFDKEFQGEN